MSSITSNFNFHIFILNNRVYFELNSIQLEKCWIEFDNFQLDSKLDSNSTHNELNRVRFNSFLDVKMFKKMLLLFFWHDKLEKLLKFFRNCEMIFINIVENKKFASFKIDTLRNEKFYIIFVLKFYVDILRFRLIIVDFAKHEVRNFKNLICLNLSKILIEKMLVFSWKNVNLKYLFFDLFETFKYLN